MACTASAVLLIFLSLAASAIALPSQQLLLEPSYEANTQSASENANLIFNAIHSAMRQWGSSLQHNGMSFFPASIPAGTLLYHGSGGAEVPNGPEWLAFEIEHAEVFARGRPGGGGHKPPHMEDEEDERPGEPGGRRPGFGRPEPGYLHIYQTNRPLNKVLYIDGTSAGKTDMGTLDTQDILLLENNSTRDGRMGGERERAQELCQLGKDWGGIEGFLRMEAGFELIFCDFTDGLDRISHYKRPAQNEPEGSGFNTMNSFEYVRAVAERYHGIGGGRVTLDYSSMISAYFYPANLSNPRPNPRETLPRLISSHPYQLSRIKTDLEDVWRRENSQSSTDWQGVVDMIVTRYSGRLQYLASNPGMNTSLSEINNLLNVYIDYDNISISSSINKCTNHYLLSAHPSTPQDALIHSALSTVLSKICNTLFEVRELLLQKSSVSHLIDELNEWLNWSSFKECSHCLYDEVCYTAIWPWGNTEDHFSPRCKNTTLISQQGGERYWGGWGGGRPPDRDRRLEL